jgi:hypothetical protein
MYIQYIDENIVKGILNFKVALSYISGGWIWSISSFELKGGGDMDFQLGYYHNHITQKQFIFLDDWWNIIKSSSSLY